MDDAGKLLVMLRRQSHARQLLASNGSVSNRFCWFGLQLVNHWFGLNRLALENSLIQFGLSVRMVWTDLD